MNLVKVARGEGKYESGIEVLSEKANVTIESEELVHTDRYESLSEV